MDERKVVKDALKKEYLKEITHQLSKKWGFLNSDIYVDEEGFLKLGRVAQIKPDVLFELLSYLGTELADSKAELWLQTHSARLPLNGGHPALLQRGAELFHSV
jgi:hypothetical protein